MTEEVGTTVPPRYFAFVVDNLFAMVPGFVTMAILRPENNVTGGVIVCLLYLVYFFVFEAVWSRTPGKVITGLEVRMSGGGALSSKAAAIRTLARILEANPLLFGGLPAVISIFATKRKQRIGDMLADTVVVVRTKSGRIAE